MKKIFLVFAIVIITSIITSVALKRKNLQKLGEIKLVGLEVRTTNLALMNSNIMDDLIKKVSSEASGKMFIVYKDYSEGFKEDVINKELTVFVGFEGVAKTNLVNLNIPAQNYMVFETKMGELPSIVINAWKAIWGNKKLSEKRSFKYDFEVYDENINPKNTQIKIYIGIK